MVLSTSVPLLALLAVLSSSATSSTSASPTQPQEAGGSSSKQAYRYALGKRARTFADASGMFDVSAFQQEKDMVVHKYAHANARYRRNLEQGKVHVRSRRAERSEPLPVYDVSKREYVGSSRLLKRQNSSSGSTGSVELIDCVFQHFLLLPLIREVRVAWLVAEGCTRVQ